MEEQIYKKQVNKESISKRVVDRQQVDRHFNQSELIQMFSADDIEPKSRPEHCIPVDNVLADQLKKFDVIHRYHEHETLLLNTNEDSLNDHEKDNAWWDYDLLASETDSARSKALSRKC